MKKFLPILLILFIGCQTPQAVIVGIQGNEQTIKEDAEVWSIILKSPESDMWTNLFAHHKKTCDKCENIEQMKQHLLLREQAHWLRASKLKEWAEK